MGANLTFNDNDDVQLKGATDQTLVGNVGDKLKGALFDSAGASITVGQKSSSSSVPVVLASDQSVLTISSVPSDGTKVTYSAAVISSALPALATDFFSLTGSGTKTIRVTEMSVAFTGGGTVINVQLLKRSTANSGGTATTLTAVPHDSQSAAATATARVYTANPTLGTLVGVIRADKTDSPLTSSTTYPEGVRYDFGTRPSQAIVLRGAGEVLAYSLNGVTLSGGTIAAFIEWTEE